ncbi:MAG: hypothetical protein KGI57_09290, partial [Hyphomicrobiales bacterium]|nr:hypothetical protein [Hyphomicrobiales bacterium]
PPGCAAATFDSRRLATTGSVALDLARDGTVAATASVRSAYEDRPWSPAPRRPFATPRPSINSGG